MMLGVFVCFESDVGVVFGRWVWGGFSWWQPPYSSLRLGKTEDPTTLLRFI